MLCEPGELIGAEMTLPPFAFAESVAGGRGGGLGVGIALLRSFNGGWVDAGGVLSSFRGIEE